MKKKERELYKKYNNGSIRIIKYHKKYIIKITSNLLYFNI